MTKQGWVGSMTTRSVLLLKANDVPEFVNAKVRSGCFGRDLSSVKSTATATSAKKDCHLRAELLWQTATCDNLVGPDGLYIECSAKGVEASEEGQKCEETD